MDRVKIYRWADAPNEYRRRFARIRRDWITYVPKGHSLGATHWTRRLQDTVERTSRDGSTLIAGNEPELGEMN